MTTKRDTPARKRENDLRANRRAAAARERDPSLPAWTPRGPSGEHAHTPPVNLAVGQELRGQSTLLNGAGALSGRWDKSGIAPNPAQFEIVPPGHHVTTTSTYVRADGQIGGQHIRAEHDKIAREQALIVALRESIERYVVPVDAVPAPENFDVDTCGIIPVGDSHIGMLAHADEVGEHSDLRIQERDLAAATDHLLAGMPASETCTIIPLGDNMHADDDQQVTPAHRNKLDVDGRTNKVARTAINVYRRMIDRALQRFAHVNVEVVGGNHDPVTSLWLRISLELIYRQEPRVHVNPSPAALRVWSFGRNLFGTCHGDGIKPEDMMGVMASRYRELWGNADFAYGFQGHRHRRFVVEKNGGVVEVFRTLTGKDSFAAKYGYESGQDLVGITYHKDYGEIERKTVGKLLARSGAKK